MITVILIIVVMGLVGLSFGLVLAFANKQFAVEMNPLIHIVEDVLPKGQCGACGFAGCQAYAEAVVLYPDIPPNLCTPGKEPVARKVSELTGKKAKQMEPRVAHLKCAQAIRIAKRKYVYSGINDCVAASILHLGPKDCQFGCIGYGTCKRACPFGAITMNSNGLPVINKKYCTGCGKCENACPKKLIQMVPAGVKVTVNCNSRNKGSIARKQCPIACIGCGICVKQCPHGAVKVENNIAIVDFSICSSSCTEAVCCDKCPTGAIKKSVKK